MLVGLTALQDTSSGVLFFLATGRCMIPVRILRQFPMGDVICTPYVFTWNYGSLGGKGMRYTPCAQLALSVEH